MYDLERVLIFAYDGSLNGDWVAHYAVRFAVHTAARQLRVVHVYEAGGPEAQLPDRLARIGAECALLGVALETELLPRAGSDVSSRILAAVPDSSTVVAGARARARAGSLLAGTIAARLIDARRVPVIAIRVVHPGVLGQPGRVLLPVFERAGSAAAALSVLRLLGPELSHLHVVLIHQLSGLRARFQLGTAAQRRVSSGRQRLASIEDELRAGLAPHQPLLDSSAVVVPDAAREIALQAARYRSRLICLDADATATTRRLAADTTLERVLRDAPADVAVYRNVP